MSDGGGSIEIMAEDPDDTLKTRESAYLKVLHEVIELFEACKNSAEEWERLQELRHPVPRSRIF